MYIHTYIQTYIQTYSVQTQTDRHTFMHIQLMRTRESTVIVIDMDVCTCTRSSAGKADRKRYRVRRRAPSAPCPDQAVAAETNLVGAAVQNQESGRDNGTFGNCAIREGRTTSSPDLPSPGALLLCRGPEVPRYGGAVPYGLCVYILYCTEYVLRMSLFCKYVQYGVL